MPPPAGPLEPRPLPPQPLPAQQQPAPAPIPPPRFGAPREPRPGFRAVGRIERSWGLRGHLKIEPLTDFPQRFAPGARVFVAGAPRTIAAARWHKGRVYVRIDGIASPAAADALRDELVEVEDADRPPFDDAEYYIDEILGCAVHGLDGSPLGALVEIIRSGPHDVYVVERPGKQDLLLPALRAVVRSVDLAARRIVVDVPPGLDPDDPPASPRGV